jgi:Tol biopolymer transport system component
MAPSAHASFPGANGKIAFERGGDIWTMNPDGTNQVNLTNDAPVESDPAWSPDGTRIAFNQPLPSGQKAWWMLADGTNRTLADDGGSFPNRYYPAWSPDGTKLLFLAASGVLTMNPDGTGVSDTGGRANLPSDWSPDGRLIATEIVKNAACKTFFDLAVVHLDGSPEQDLTPTDPDCNNFTVDTGASWAPNSQRIAYFAESLFCNSPPCTDAGFFTIKPDGTDRQQLLNGGADPAWSPDGTKIAFDVVNPAGIKIMNTDGTGVTDIAAGTNPSWQPIPINTYPRPKGATPLRVPLVPANKPCTAPNSTHGAPLSYDSCAPPQLTSGQLTTGTPDSNGLPVRMEASLLLRVIPGNFATPQNEADVKIEAHLNDVLDKSLNDHTGSLRAALPLRITDRDNTPSPGGPGAGTTVPFQYGFDIPCTPDPATNIGSDCSISTTADTLVPGTIKESLRTIWQIGRVRVDDAGPDGNPDTTADNTVFAVQGVFVP